MNDRYRFGHEIDGIEPFGAFLASGEMCLRRVELVKHVQQVSLEAHAAEVYEIIKVGQEPEGRDSVNCVNDRV